MFSWYTDFLYGIKDPLSGLKAYRIEIYKEIGHFDSFCSCGTEMIIYAAKNNYSIGQFNFEIFDREDEPRFGGSLKANCKIIRALILSFWKIK